MNDDQDARDALEREEESPSIVIGRPPPQVVALAGILSAHALAQSLGGARPTPEPKRHKKSAKLKKQRAKNKASRKARKR